MPAEQEPLYRPPTTMNGAEAQPQQRSESGSKSLEEAMEEGNGAGLYKEESGAGLRGRRASGSGIGSGSGEGDAPAAAPEGPRPRVGVNSESEVGGCLVW